MDPSTSAYILLSDESDFYFLSYLFLLLEVLGEVNQTQMYFQSSGIRLEQSTVKHQVLEWFFEDQHLDIEKSVICATIKCKKMDILQKMKQWEE